MFWKVGIYGYTAYPARKFGLWGLAEALQQEVIADDIHVSLIFPPDTDTPGLEEGTQTELGLLHFPVSSVLLLLHIAAFENVGGSATLA